MLNYILYINSSILIIDYDTDVVTMIDTIENEFNVIDTY